jgi:hypothetical protein
VWDDSRTPASSREPEEPTSVSKQQASRRSASQKSSRTPAPYSPSAGPESSTSAALSIWQWTPDESQPPLLVQTTEAKAIRQGWGNSRESITTADETGALTRTAPVAYYENQFGGFTDKTEGVISASRSLHLVTQEPEVEYTRALGTPGAFGAGSRDHNGLVTAGPVPTSGQAASPVRTSASLARDEDLPVTDQYSLLPFSTLWSDTALAPSSSKTSLASCPVIAGETWQHSSVAWLSSGMAWRSGLSTLDSSACPSGDDASSSLLCEAKRTTLTAVLQPSVPPRFFLSARSAGGILRRASKRGRELPPALNAALTSQAGPSELSQPTATAGPAGRTRTQDRSLSIPVWDELPETSDFSTPSSLPMSARVETSETAATLTTSDSPNRGGTSGPQVLTEQTVRRLTPIECERLMGWPDGHTVVKGWSSRGRSKAHSPERQAFLDRTRIRRSAEVARPP